MPVINIKPQNLKLNGPVMDIVVSASERMAKGKFGMPRNGANKSTHRYRSVLFCHKFCNNKAIEIGAYWRKFNEYSFAFSF